MIKLINKRISYLFQIKTKSVNDKTQKIIRTFWMNKGRMIEKCCLTEFEFQNAEWLKSMEAVCCVKKK